MSGWAAAWCSWRWFVRWWVRLLVYTLSCMLRLQRHVRGWTYLMAWRPRAPLHVFHGVVFLSSFFRVALCAWVVFSPHHSHTPCLSHGFLVLCVRQRVAGVLFCWWLRGGWAFFLVRLPRLPFVMWLRGVSCLAHRCTRAKCPGHRTHKAAHRPGTPADQQPSGQGHPTHNTTHGAGAPVNRNQVAQDTAHATRQTTRAHR